ncbi:MAG: acyloxyacyl hydrolase [Prevotellaceae bacterium]|nr:acyloxyacyl hydrolase [Prevotellaceae bacterium]
MIRYIFFALLMAMCHAASAVLRVDSIRFPQQIYLSALVRQGSLLLSPREDIPQNYCAGLDVRLGWQTDNSSGNLFDALYRYPHYGLGYYMGNMNGIIMNSSAQAGFGKPAALYVFFGSPVLHSKRWTAGYTISAGMSYNFNAYDPEEAPYNMLIGSKQNAYIDLSLDVSLTLPLRTTLSAGLSFQHFSNGSYQKPNKGINLLSGTLAYQWNSFRRSDKMYARTAIPAWENMLEWYILSGGGVRMIDTDFDKSNPRSGRRWSCNTISSAALVQTSFRRKFGVGLDLFYFDWGQHVLQYRAGKEGKKDAKTSIADNMALGLYLAHEVGYKRVWMITDLGVYPFGRVGDNPVNPRIYERVGIKWHLSDRLFAGIAIKAHGAKADYVEWSLGYSLIKNRLL